MSFGIFQFRRGTAAQWTSANTVLASGELGLETNTGFFKIGDGTTAWNSLAYGGLQGIQGPPGTSPVAFTNVTGNSGTAIADGVTDSLAIVGASGLTTVATDGPEVITVSPTYGSGANTITQGNDARLSDARTPTAHAASHKGGGSDVIANATTALAGLMAAASLTKLNGAYVDAVADLGADPTGGVDATTIIQNGLNAFGAGGGRLYFPAGTYKISANITISKPVILCGAGRSISVISMSNATATMFSCIAGSQGAGFEQLRLSAPTAGTRTAGYAIDFGTQANVYAQQVDILFQWSSIHSSGALQFVDDINAREGGANAANGAHILIDSTGDRYIRRLTSDQGTNPTGFATIRINECSSCVISDSNLIHGQTALDINANAGAAHAIASVYAVNTFFDTSVIGCRINCATGSDTVQRVTFVRCWFSTMSTAGVQLLHANLNSIDFIGCEFYQSPFGIDAQACTEWAVRSSRFAGNTTNAIRTTAGATHSFAITDNTIGNVAGFGANAQGINIQAGTYKRYQVIDNKGLDTNNTPGIIDLGVVGATDQKNVSNNMGALLKGQIASITVPLAVLAEAVVCKAWVPANAVAAGQVFSATIQGAHTATLIPTYRIHVGPLGTTGDPVAGLIAGATGTIGSFAELLCTVRTIGAGGTCHASGTVISGTAAAVTATAAAVALATTAGWYITLTAQASTSALTINEAVIEAL